MSAFMEVGLSGYLDGSLEEPSESKKIVEWKQYNSRIIGTLGRIVDNSLAQELSADMTAANAWLLLKKRTWQDSMVAKLNAMRAAITTKFSPTKPENATIGEIRDLLASIFEGGDPTREDWSIILMLNALDGTDLDWLRKNLITRFTNETSKPTEKEVVKAINLAGYNRRQIE
jgi:hypothetical protein